MSTQTLSTHQLDRQAQQRLQTARQQASASGQPQGAAFQQLLGLARDEDADGPRAQGLKRQLLGLAPGDADDTAAPARGRAAGRRAGRAGDAEDGTAALGQGADTPAANAALIALLERAADNTAQGDAAGDGGNGDAALAARAAGLEGPDGETPPELALADTENGAEDGTALARPATGRSTRELAQLLSAQRDGASAATSGRAAAADPAAGTDATAQAAQAALTAQATDPRADPAAPWATAQRGAEAAGASFHSRADASTDTGAETTDPLGLDSAGAGPGTVSSAAPGAEARPQHGGSPGEPAGQADGPAASAATDDAASPQAEAWRQQWQDTMDQVAHQVSYWMGQGVHQARLRVASGAAQTMEVQLSLKGGKADLAFHTDHEQARQALSEGGTGVLRQWLAQSGIDLGQVSIGAGSAGSGGSDGSGQAGGNGAAPGQPLASAQAPDAPSAAPRGAHAANGRASGLDLYV